jgi:hypothetical protein
MMSGSGVTKGRLGGAGVGGWEDDGTGGAEGQE